MRKSELASYLVSLNALMTSQFHGASGVTSPTLAAEFAKHWDMLRERIKEDFDEARNGSKPDGLDKDSAGEQGDQSGRGQSYRPGAVARYGTEGNDLWTGIEGSDGKSD